MQEPTPRSVRKHGVRYWVNLLAAAGIVGLVLYVQGTIYLLTRPARSSVCCQTPAGSGFVYEDVTLTASDGVALAGWYIPSQNGAAVILLHGYGGSRLGTWFQAQALAGAGFGVLLYDARASGESGGEKRSFGWQDIGDVPAAIAFLQARTEVDPHRMGILGVSTGGEIALNAAAQNEALRAVLVDGAGFAVGDDIPPPATLRERLMHPAFPLLFAIMSWESGIPQPPPISQVIGRIAPRPLLLVSTGSGLEKRQNEMYYHLAGEPKVHWNVPDAWHGSLPQTHPQAYAQQIVAFFNQWLRAAP